MARIEGSKCMCSSEEEHALLVQNVNESHKLDYDGSRRAYADRVSTSQALRKRALASTNGQYH